MGQSDSYIKEAIIIALDKQIHLYSVDTKAFYTDEEKPVGNELAVLRAQRKKLKTTIKALEKYYSCDITEQSTKKIKKTLKNTGVIADMKEDIPLQVNIADLITQHKNLKTQIDDKNQRLRNAIDTCSNARHLREEYLCDRNVISFSESFLTRTLGTAPDPSPTEDIVVVKTFHHKVLKDIICNGFTLRGERYVFFTASAGQTRTKRSMFIKESLLREHAPKLMCGLTIDRINNSKMHGVNPGKYLAYLALTCTTTEPWDKLLPKTKFDIDRCIVVDDFGTDILGVVDHIGTTPKADDYYQISQVKMAVPVPHTDGCGMVLPSVSKKNFMVRLPWVKGLLASFPFDKFVREANKDGTNHGIVKDIYGQEHDVLAENIQIIFTKSQFKMWKYYDSWDEYKRYFKKYRCEAGICNMEERRPSTVKTTYQFLQTLTDLTDSELQALSSKTVAKLNDISSDLDTMLSVLGATEKNLHRSALQEAAMLYPELLNDEYSKQLLYDCKNALRDNAIAGSVDIEGRYVFLIPDLYAFCQRLFLGIAVPSGLLQNGEVSCRLFEPGVELDCLRSPHLFKSHAVRTNMFGINDATKKWFQTDGLYTSSHDLITRFLMNDVDGDTSLVTPNQILVGAAKRNMEGVVPTYYDMPKAKPKQITPDTIFETLKNAYKGSNIGIPSNAITKLLNTGRDADKYLDTIKILDMETNFVVDYAKTGFKLERPPAIDAEIRMLTKGKLPHFFREAKRKTKDQVAPITDSCVNRLRNLIPNPKLNFKILQHSKFDWLMLTSARRDVDIAIDRNTKAKEVIDTFEKSSKKTKVTHDPETDNTNWYYVCQKIRNDLLAIHPDINFIVNVLVKYLFVRKKSKRKRIFWECFGWEVVENLRTNMKRKGLDSTKLCKTCGERYKPTNNRQKYCSECRPIQRHEQEAARQQRRRKRVRI